MIVGYAVFIATLAATACFVALFGRDNDHRMSGYRVLKLVWMTVTGSVGVVTLALKLSEWGVLPGL
uniref:hypothetical protein n=1 Tax=Saccharothrix espanaensis TaxID=103731 RepID=UPI003F492185